MMIFIEQAFGFFQDEAAMAGLVALLVAFNLVLSGLSKILDLVKDKTATKIDNQTAAFITKMASKLQKLIDWLGANREHKKEVK